MPGALLVALLAAAPAVTVAPAQARPGDAVLVRVAGARETPVGTLAGRPLLFWRQGGEWRALGALPLETAPGDLSAAVEAGGARAEAALSVIDPRFPSRHLTLPRRYVEEPVDPRLRARIARDRRAFDAAWNQPPAPPRFLGGFGWPRVARITGRFGDQRVLNEEKPSVHYGLDLGGPRGAPVRAAADGVVVLARDAYYSGKTVVLWHGAGVFTLYFHLDRIGVRKGATVRRGQRVGRLGATGRASGPHLHWSAKVGGLYVDPESLLALDFRAGTAPPRQPREAAAPEPAPPAEPAAQEPAIPAEPSAPAAPAAEAPGHDPPGAPPATDGEPTR